MSLSFLRSLFCWENIWWNDREYTIISLKRGTESDEDEFIFGKSCFGGPKFEFIVRKSSFGAPNFGLNDVRYCAGHKCKIVIPGLCLGANECESRDTRVMPGHEVGTAAPLRDTSIGPHHCGI